MKPLYAVLSMASAGCAAVWMDVPFYPGVVISSLTVFIFTAWGICDAIKEASKKEDAE